MFVEARSELVFISAALGLDGEGDRRLGKLHARILNGRGLVAESVAGQRVFQFRDGANIAGMQFIDRDCGLALHDRDVSKFFLRAAAVIHQRRIILQNAGENLEIRNAAGECVRDGLEYI